MERQLETINGQEINEEKSYETLITEEDSVEEIKKPIVEKKVISFDIIVKKWLYAIHTVGFTVIDFEV